MEPLNVPDTLDRFKSYLFPTPFSDNGVNRLTSVGSAAKAGTHRAQGASESPTKSVRRSIAHDELLRLSAHRRECARRIRLSRYFRSTIPPHRSWFAAPGTRRLFTLAVTAVDAIRPCTTRAVVETDWVPPPGTPTNGGNTRRCATVVRSMTQWRQTRLSAVRNGKLPSSRASRKGPAARSSGVCLPLTCCRRGNNGRYGVVS